MGPDQCRRLYLATLLQGDQQAAGDAIEKGISAGMALSDLYLKVFAPALKRIGDLWSDGKISVAQEHLATQITLGEMEKLRSIHRARRRLTYRVLVACVEGEEHFVGVRMMADLFSLEGWAIDFLGPNVPTSTLVDMVDDRRPHLLALSVTMKHGVKQALRVVQLVKRLAVQPKILVGGNALVNNQLRQEKNSGCAVASDAIDGLKLGRNLLHSDHPKAVLQEYLKELGRRVRELRTRAGWTQQQLAEVTNLARAYVVSVEGGKQNVSIDVLLRIANALRVSPEGLLSGNESYLASPAGSSR